ncbi:MAG TPA: helix-turn-helix transcriptional regulator [Chthoniobacterales bacterium]|jgi:DNA-binding CsgD family transcriptional regulator
MHSQPLTLRETEIVKWIAEGKTNFEIAIILGISRATVKTHVEHVLQKLDVTTRTAAAVCAVREGVLTT